MRLLGGDGLRPQVRRPHGGGALRILAASAFAMAFAATAAAAQSFQSPMHAFHQICLPYLQQGDASIAVELDSLTPDQLETWKMRVGLEGDDSIKAAHAFSAGSHGILWLDDGNPGACILVSTASWGAGELGADWTNYIASDETAFRQDGEFSTRDDRAPFKTVSTGWASMPHGENGFLQLSLSYRHHDEVGWMTIAGAVVGRTPASCNLWPERCEG